MDPIIRRVNDLARKLANDRHAISLHTAQGLVREIACSEGFDSLPSHVADLLAGELCALIEEHWRGEQAEGDVAS